MKFKKYNKKDSVAVQNIFAKYWTDKEFLDEIAENIGKDNTYFYVAEENDEIVGVAGFREAPKYLHDYAKTKNPAELYIIASKLQNKGFGSLLAQKVIEEAKKLHFTEIECYSPETHNSSWKFYEKLGFTKYGIINDPDDGYPGMLWIKII
jgi:RimJ/RimL family protein N-acetyltransferase